MGHCQARSAHFYKKKLKSGSREAYFPPLILSVAARWDFVKSQRVILFITEAVFAFLRLREYPKPKT